MPVKNAEIKIEPNQEPTRESCDCCDDFAEKRVSISGHPDCRLIICSACDTTWFRPDPEIYSWICADNEREKLEGLYELMEV